jgi:predicted nucleic acid-binding protein
LLDTNVVSELRKIRAHGGVTAWLESTRDENLLLPAVVIAELQAGAELTRLHDRLKALEIEIWIERIASTYRVIPMDGVCFREWARLMHGKSDSLYEDAMIAATARVHGLTIATRNERDFKMFSVPLFNPFRQ